jgi:hypothetical protein
MWLFCHIALTELWRRGAVLLPVMVVPMPEWLSLCLVLGGAAVTAALLLIARGRLTGTTLMAVGVWALVAVVVIAASEASIWLAGDGISVNSAVALRWIAACSTFCPMMAQLGAKRPQDRGWQWIVLSLWVILALPAAQAFVLGRTIQVSTVWWGFAWVLVTIGTLNMLPTRYWLSAICVGSAQTALLLGYKDQANQWPAIGVCLLAAATIAAFWSARRQRTTATPLERVWFDFRDLFGVVWALRIGEQLNKSSEMYGWGVNMRWDGLFDTSTGEPVTTLDEATEAAIAQSLRTMLRRFVSPQWLDARLSPELQ